MALNIDCLISQLLKIFASIFYKRFTGGSDTQGGTNSDHQEFFRILYENNVLIHFLSWDFAHRPCSLQRLKIRYLLVSGQVSSVAVKIRYLLVSCQVSSVAVKIRYLLVSCQV